MPAEPNSIPIQPADRPIICGPYTEPNDHWIYDKESGRPLRAGTRRPAGYWYKTQKTGSAQQHLFVEEERDDLPLVNLLRDEVRRWREADYRGASNVTKDLLRHWASPDRPRRLFFCQREAVETIIYLAELRIPGRSARTGFQKFPVSDEDLARLLRGERPGFDLSAADFFPTLADPSGHPDLIPLRRMGCKMATGSGKTVVMSMLIAWAFCNRGMNLASREFPKRMKRSRVSGVSYQESDPDTVSFAIGNGLPSTTSSKGARNGEANERTRPRTTNEYYPVGLVGIVYCLFYGDSCARRRLEPKLELYV